MKRDIGLYLEDIVESIKLIEDYTKDLNQDEFGENIAIQDAVMRRFEIIGEAVKNVPPEFKTQHSEILWKQIAGMRDVLVHEYFEINVERVWNTIKDDLPEFKKLLEPILHELE